MSEETLEVTKKYKYTCPSCGKGFDKTKKYKKHRGCPHCTIDLTYKKIKNPDGKGFLGGKFVITEGTIKEETAPSIANIIEEEDTDLDCIFTSKDSTELHFKYKSKENLYLVRFLNHIPVYTYCPNCNKKLIRNITLYSDEAQSYTCDAETDAKCTAHHKDKRKKCGALVKIEYKGMGFNVIKQ